MGGHLRGLFDVDFLDVDFLVLIFFIMVAFLVHRDFFIHRLLFHVTSTLPLLLRASTSSKLYQNYFPLISFATYFVCCFFVVSLDIFYYKCYIFKWSFFFPQAFLPYTIFPHLSYNLFLSRFPSEMAAQPKVLGSK